MDDAIHTLVLKVVLLDNVDEVIMLYVYMHEVEKIIKKFEVGLNKPQFYIPKIKKFFNETMSEEYFRNKKINEITSHEITLFLSSGEEVKNNYSNYYYALKKFFDFTYRKNMSGNVLKDVKKPVKRPRKIKYLSVKQIDSIRNYIKSTNNEIENRLLIGLFLYTGLSRQHVARLTIGSLDFENSSLHVKQDSPQIPIPQFLNNLLKEYVGKLSVEDSGGLLKLINISENEISNKVSRILKKEVGTNVTPTILSNTFIKECLRKTGNDVMLISEYLLETPLTVAKHIDEVSKKDKYEKQKEMISDLF